MEIAYLLAGYLAGSIPFGVLLVRLVAHKDVREVGSGNIGATNVARAAGKKVGVLVLVLDALKGFLPALVALRALPAELAAGVGLAAVLGHVFPVWLRFRGGKGVATALGVSLAFVPEVAVSGVLVYGVVYLGFRISSLGSLLAALIGVVVGFAFAPHPAFAWAIVAIVVVILARHAGNIRRLLRREESRV